MGISASTSPQTVSCTGWGADIDHILGADSDPEGSPEVMIGQETFPAVTSPVLIEENVAYARTGGKCIVYLKNDGSVWWQGRYEDISYSGIVVEQSFLYNLNQGVDQRKYLK
ncbi:MAG TPA: hypothetical protein H9981_09000 [Candidatus Mediterraneibacter caccavium]|uniref:Uncharacterized protein n=1 Tax=Candidatus Mediterraneibacter caccavium TaxID=2838661 RepID=A0A9D1VYF9_9FIRM|nr:hypothetical protein [Candidatus Mediterraneibacter caccavium]